MDGNEETKLEMTEVEIHEINLGGVSDISGFFTPKIGEMIQFDYLFKWVDASKKAMNKWSIGQAKHIEKQTPCYEGNEYVLARCRP